MLREDLCNDVSTEPLLLTSEGIHIQYRTAHESGEVRVDVSALSRHRHSDPMASYHCEMSLKPTHQKNEQKERTGMGPNMRIG